MDSVVLTKLISSLLYPAGLALLCAVFSLGLRIFSLKRLSQVFKYLSILVLLLASNPQIARMAMSSLESQNPQRPFSAIAKHDLILVLGGSLRLPIPPALSVQLGAGSDRLWHAAQLYRAAKADKIMLAGGNVFQQAGLAGESVYAAELLQSWGIQKAAIVTEGKSRNTEQNFANIIDYIHSQKIESVLLVTSAYHMPRAMHTFHAQLQRDNNRLTTVELKITPSAADIMIRDDAAPAFLKWVPSAQALYMTTMAVHEYYGKWFVDLKALITRG